MHGRNHEKKAATKKRARRGASLGGSLRFELWSALPPSIWAVEACGRQSCTSCRLSVPVETAFTSLVIVSQRWHSTHNGGPLSISLVTAYNMTTLDLVDADHLDGKAWPRGRKSLVQARLGAGYSSAFCQTIILENSNLTGLQAAAAGALWVLAQFQLPRFIIV